MNECNKSPFRVYQSAPESNKRKFGKAYFALETLHLIRQTKTKNATQTILQSTNKNHIKYISRNHVSATYNCLISKYR